MSADKILTLGLVSNDKEYKQAKRYLNTLQKIINQYEVSKIDPEKIEKLKTMALKVFGHTARADEWVIEQQKMIQKHHCTSKSKPTDLESLIKKMSDPEHNSFNF